MFTTTTRKMLIFVNIFLLAWQPGSQQRSQVTKSRNACNKVDCEDEEKVTHHALGEYRGKVNKRYSSE